LAEVGDPYNLERFVSAQNPIYDRVCDELRNGRKSSHWMWFVFPQLRGLGSSPMAEKYGIASRAEARAYLDHRILGPRLMESTALVNQIESRSAAQIFGYPDDLKFRSSMTLFATVAPGNPFTAALQKYFAAEPDSLTLELLR
jgi:uncharacterized protein (DUF1810 family)